MFKEKAGTATISNHLHSLDASSYAQNDFQNQTLLFDQVTSLAAGSDLLNLSSKLSSAHGRLNTNHHVVRHNDSSSFAQVPSEIGAASLKVTR